MTIRWELVGSEGLMIMNLVMTCCALASTVGEIDYIADGIDFLRLAIMVYRSFTVVQVVVIINNRSFPPSFYGSSMTPA